MVYQYIDYRALSTISPRIMRTRHQCKQPKSVNYKLFLRPAPNIAVARSADDFYFFPKQIEDLEYDRSFFYLPLHEDVTIETRAHKDNKYFLLIYTMEKEDSAREYLYQLVTKYLPQLFFSLSQRSIGINPHAR